MAFLAVVFFIGVFGGMVLGQVIALVLRRDEDDLPDWLAVNVLRAVIVLVVVVFWGYSPADSVLPGDPPGDRG